MSIHWALLDNFYVLPNYRYLGLGASLLEALRKKLMEKKVQYLSALFHDEDSETTNFFKKQGVASQDKYLWMDIFVDKIKLSI